MTNGIITLLCWDDATAGEVDVVVVVFILSRLSSVALNLTEKLLLKLLLDCLLGSAAGTRLISIIFNWITKLAHLSRGSSNCPSLLTVQTSDMHYKQEE